MVATDFDSYLRELQDALAGADPALVQDALFDAEEHLQEELAGGTGFAEIVEHYGSPQEVAAAYLGADPMTVHTFEATPTEGAPPHAGPQEPTPSPLPAGVQAGMAAASTPPSGPDSVLYQVFGVFIDARVYKTLVYMLLSIVTGTAYFSVVVTGLSTAGGLLVLVIGLPFLMLVLGIVRGMALFEGRLVELLLGTRMPRRPRAEPPNAGFLQRMGFWLKDGRTWASMVYMILMLPLGIIYFTIAVTGLAVVLGLITSPFWAWIGDYSFVIDGVTHHWWFPIWGIPIAVVGGFVVLLAWLHLIRWIGHGHAAFAKALLVRLTK